MLQLTRGGHYLRMADIFHALDVWRQFERTRSVRHELQRMAPRGIPVHCFRRRRSQHRRDGIRVKCLLAEIYIKVILNRRARREQSQYVIEVDL